VPFRSQMMGCRDASSSNSSRKFSESFLKVRKLPYSMKSSGFLQNGYGLSSPEVVSVLDQARDVYNVDRLAQVAASACLKDRVYFEKTRNEIIKERERLVSKLKEWKWETSPSGANFVFARPVNANGGTGPAVAKDLFEFLDSKRILIRYFPHHERTASHVRISIGNRQDMDILYERLSEWIHQE